MRPVPPRTLVIVNPRSAGGATGRRWRSVEARLRAALGSFEVEVTRGPRDAERIAREAVRAGIARLVVAGGDGTLGEVVSGLLAADLGRQAQVGVLPLGTGGDFARSLRLPRSLDAAIQAIAAGKSRSVDAGRARFCASDGRQSTACFANVASFGMSGEVVERVNRGSKRLGGRLAFLSATVATLMHHRCEVAELRLDGEPLFAGPLLLAAAANGGWFGGGMHVAPRAQLDDGLLDVVVVGEMSRAALLRRLPRIYRGSHLGDPALTLRRGRVLEADAEPGRIWLELDGELRGTLPARIELLPGALELIEPAA
jgi:YegS/Rv2252/BmrU family lipid kinase